MSNKTEVSRVLFQNTKHYLSGKRRILFLTTSNRWVGEKNGSISKSTLLARRLANDIGLDKVTILDVPSLNIYPCEGNVSLASGNTCGVRKSLLKDAEKNPSGFHRCWASINNPDDELWKVSRELFQSDCVVFFSSVRWGQTNAFYQKLIERLTWIENRHSTLGEESITKGIEAGIILVGQNWKGESVLETQKQVLDFYGFETVEDLCWHWQYMDDSENEDPNEYVKAAHAFSESFFVEKEKEA